MHVTRPLVYRQQNALAMSTQTVDRAADGTEDCRSVLSVTCEENDCFDSSRYMGR